MVKKNTPAKKESNTAKALVGTGIVAALAGAYFLYGSKDAAKNRKKIKGWTLKAKGEILEKLEKVEHASQAQYETTVDAVLGKYKALKNVDLSEVEALEKDLKKHWKAFQAELKKVKKA
jgi:hypothetical protein